MYIASNVIEIKSTPSALYTGNTIFKRIWILMSEALTKFELSSSTAISPFSFLPGVAYYIHVLLSLTVDLCDTQARMWCTTSSPTRKWSTTHRKVLSLSYSSSPLTWSLPPAVAILPSLFYTGWIRNLLCWGGRLKGRVYIDRGQRSARDSRTTCRREGTQQLSHARITEQ